VGQPGRPVLVGKAGGACGVAFDTERALWSRRGSSYTRQADSGVRDRIRLEVRPSAIQGHGLFLCGTAPEGARLGRLWGRVAFSSLS
jgi:hypothetical protein